MTDNTQTSLDLPAGPLRDAFAALNSLYVKTRRHGAALSEMQRLFMSSTHASSHQGFSLQGDTGAGKTTTVRQLESWLREQLGLHPEAPSPLPIVTMHADMTPRGLVETLLGVYGDPMPTTGKRSDLDKRLRKFTRDAEHIRGIVLDEAQHGFVGKTGGQRRLMTAALTDFVSECPRPVLALGPLALDEHLDGDPALQQRFAERAYLEDLRLDLDDDLHDVRAVLRGMDALLPSAPGCRLDSADMLKRLYVASQGSFGRKVRVVRLACSYGAIDGAPAVQMHHYSKAWRAVAPRKLRHEKHDPFLLDGPTVTALAAQLNTKLKVND